MNLVPHRATRLLAILALPLAACGGGGGGDNGGNGGNVDLTATLPLLVDGRTGTMTTVPEIFSVATVGGYVELGDDVAYGADVDTRGFLTFDLAPLPPGAVISSAVVHLSAQATGNPYGVHGLPLVDHVFLTGPDLVLANFSGNNITQGVALFPTFVAGPFQPAEFDVTGPVRDDFEGARATSTFRVWFALSPEANTLDDMVLIQVSTTDAALRPFVVVTYR